MSQTKTFFILLKLAGSEDSSFGHHNYFDCLNFFMNSAQQTLTVQSQQKTPEKGEKYG